MHDFFPLQNWYLKSAGDEKYRIKGEVDVERMVTSFWVFLGSSHMLVFTFRTFPKEPTMFDVSNNQPHNHKQ